MCKVTKYSANEHNTEPLILYALQHIGVYWAICLADARIHITYYIDYQ